MADWWSWQDDRQRASSRLQEMWVPTPGDPHARTYLLEVRSNNYGFGSHRLGEMVFTGRLDGTLTLKIMDEIKY